MKLCSATPTTSMIHGGYKLIFRAALKTRQPLDSYGASLPIFRWLPRFTSLTIVRTKCSAYSLFLIRFIFGLTENKVVRLISEQRKRFVLFARGHSPDSP